MSVYVKHLMATMPNNTSRTISLSEEFTAGMILSFVLGYLWVRHRTENETQEARGIKQRIDYVFVLGLGWPLVYFLLLNTYSLFDSPVAMALLT